MQGKEVKKVSEVDMLYKLMREGNWVECALWSEIAAYGALERGDTDAACEALFTCGYARGALDDLEGAIESYEEARQLGFNKKGVLFNLANAYRGKGMSKKACEIYEEVLKLEPNDGGSVCNLAITWEDLGDLEKADYYFQKGAEIFPEHEDAVTNLGYTLLRKADFINGWPVYERRRGKDKLTGIMPSYRHGEDLAEKRVLLMVEQGYGDVVMFSGLARELKQKTAKLGLVSDEKLLPILKRSLEGIDVFSSMKHDDLYGFDVLMSVGSLGIECRNVSADHFKPVKPYLKASKTALQRVDREIQKLASEDVVIGIAWKGGADHRNKKRRSISLDELRPLLQLKGVRWINMQYGDTREEVLDFENSTGVKIHTLFDPTDDFESLVACLKRVDLVVSVQQTLIHFAGACGTKTEALIPAIPEWRYGREGKRMMWWESVTLHRQQKIGQWDDAISSVKTELEMMTGVQT